MKPTYLHRPADRADIAVGRALHNDCGGRVVFGQGWLSLWECERCSRKWSTKAMDDFTPEELEDRFHSRVYPTTGTMEVLVWVDDPITGRFFAKLVPLWQAGDYERVKA